MTFNGAFNLDETRHSYVYNPYYGQFDSTGGTVSKYHTRTYDYNLQQLVSYARSFGDNNFDILLGHEYYDYRYYELGASKSQMFSQGNKELDGAIIDGQGASSYKERRNNEGFFGRLHTIMTNASSARLLCVVMLPAVSIRTIAGVHSGR